MTNLTSVDWSTIPAPEDDGAADQLAGTALPAMALRATDGSQIDLSKQASMTVVFIYPKTGQPGVPSPEGWDMIPGARGCTPQACAFRDLYGELRELGVDHLFGLSVQDTDYQREAAERLHLPFPLLSDQDFQLTNALTLPTFEAAGMRLLKRLTLVIADGKIVHAFYPVFPPDRSADDVIAWMKARSEAAR